MPLKNHLSKNLILTSFLLQKLTESYLSAIVIQGASIFVEAASPGSHADACGQVGSLQKWILIISKNKRINYISAISSCSEN